MGTVPLALPVGIGVATAANFSAPAVMVTGMNDVVYLSPKVSQAEDQVVVVVSPEMVSVPVKNCEHSGFSAAIVHSNVSALGSMLISDGKGKPERPRERSKTYTVRDTVVPFSTSVVVKSYTILIDDGP